MMHLRCAQLICVATYLYEYDALLCLWQSCLHAFDDTLLYGAMKLLPVYPAGSQQQQQQQQCKAAAGCTASTSGAQELPHWLTVT